MNKLQNLEDVSSTYEKGEGTQMGREKQFDNEVNFKKQTAGGCEFHVDIKEVTQTGERKQVDK